MPAPPSIHITLAHTLPFPNSSSVLFPVTTSSTLLPLPPLLLPRGIRIKGVWVGAAAGGLSGWNSFGGGGRVCSSSPFYPHYPLPLLIIPISLAHYCTRVELEQKCQCRMGRGIWGGRRDRSTPYDERDVYCVPPSYPSSPYSNLITIAHTHATLGQQ